MKNEQAIQTARLRVRGVVEGLRRVSNRLLIAAKDREESRVAARESLPSVKERQRELILFYRFYEELVETLCDAAQYGPSEKLENEYQRLREWINANYPAVRKYVVAFLRYSADDAEQGIALWGRSADAFEALVAAESLEDFIRADNGCMISRINRSREALNLYGEHLRQLAAVA